MNRLDNIISEVAYILDSLIALRRINESGNCNECAYVKHCEYKPELGQQVRYNCPFFERESDERSD